MSGAALILLAPAALAGLLLLPVLWWLHRRARRPPVVDVPSLLFLEPEARPAGARVARPLDAELLLALLAGTLLVLAASRPVVRLGAPGRTVRVVALAADAPGGFAARRDAAIGAIRAELGPADRLDLVEAGDAERRVDDLGLLAAARAGAASLRVVVSDRATTRDLGGVRWVALGAPGAANVGIVAASVEPAGAGVRVFVNLAADGPREARVVVRCAPAGAAEVTREAVVPHGGHATATFELPSAPPEIRVSLEPGDGGRSDDGPRDDAVRLTRAPLVVRFDSALPASHRETLERGLALVLGEGGLAAGPGAADLFVSRAGGERAAGGGRVLAVAVAGPDAAPAEPGTDVAADDPLARDLATAGRDLVPAGGPGDGAALVLGRRAGGRLVPVVVRRGADVGLVCDPLAGARPLAESPFLPLFLENLVGEVAGPSAGAGYRVAPAPDPALASVGRDVRPYDPAWLAAAPADRPAPDRPLAPWLTGAVAVALLLLWSRVAAPRPAADRRLRRERRPAAAAARRSA